MLGLQSKATRCENMYYQYRREYKQVSQESNWNCFKLFNLRCSMAIIAYDALDCYQLLNLHWKYVSLYVSFYEINLMKYITKQYGDKLTKIVQYLNLEETINLEKKLESFALSQIVHILKILSYRYLAESLQDPLNPSLRQRIRRLYEKIIEGSKSTQSYKNYLKYIIVYELAQPNPDISYLLNIHQKYQSININQIFFYLLKRDYESAKRLKNMYFKHRENEDIQALIHSMQKKNIKGLESCKIYIKSNFTLSFLFPDLVKSLEKEISEIPSQVKQTPS